MHIIFFRFAVWINRVCSSVSDKELQAWAHTYSIHSKINTHTHTHTHTPMHTQGCRAV